MTFKYVIACARLIANEAVRDIRDVSDMGQELEDKVNDLAEQGYTPINMTSEQGIVCVLMKK